MISTAYFRGCGVLLWSALAALPALAQPNVPIPAVEPEPPLLKTVTWPEVEKQIGGLTLVSLRAQNMPAADALSAVAQQMLPPARAELEAARIDPRDPRPQTEEKTLTAEYEKQPFWVVMHDVAQKLKTRLDRYSYDTLAFLPPGMAQPELTTASGPCVFSLRNALYTRYLNQLVPGARDGRTNAGGILAAENLVLNGSVYIDPKIRWYPVGLSLHLQEALDDKNQSLLPTEDKEIYASDTVQNANLFQEIGLSLKPAAQPSKTLKSLRGGLHGIVATRGERWEIDDVLHAKAEDLVKTITDGDKEIRLTLKAVVKNGSNLIVKLIAMQNTPFQSATVRLSTGKEVGLASYNNTVVSLLDNAGTALNRNNFTSISNGTGEMEQNEVGREKTYALEMSFGPNGGFGIGAPNTSPDAATNGPVKFVLEYKTDWRELIVPFEFKDVPLP